MNLLLHAIKCISTCLWFQPVTPHHVFDPAISEKFNSKVFVLLGTPNDAQIPIVSNYNVGPSCERYRSYKRPEVLFGGVSELDTIHFGVALQCSNSGLICLFKSGGYESRDYDFIDRRLFEVD